MESVQKAQRYIKDNFNSKYVFAVHPDPKQNKLIRVQGSIDIEPRFTAFCNENRIPKLLRLEAADSEFIAYLPAEQSTVEQMVSEGYFMDAKAAKLSADIRNAEVIKFPGGGKGGRK